MTTETLLGYGRDYYLPVYRPREVVLARGQGARVWDDGGRDYVDFGAGIAVCSLGHCDPDLVAALVAQARIDGGDADPFYPAKIITTRFFADHQMSRAAGLASTVMNGAAGALALEESMF